MYYIYVHYNKINGHVYIGQTKQDVEKRWGKNGKRYLEKKKDGTYIHSAFARAILKYGWDNFEHLVVFKNLTKEQADAIEKEMIAEVKKTNPESLYNIREGGHDGGKPWDDEQRRKFHEARIGHPPSESSIKTIKSTQGKKVSIKELNKNFLSIGECSLFLNVTKPAIRYCLKNENRTVKGYHIVYA